MSKKLIIGLASLGIGLAVAGGVGGYFVADALNENKIPTNQNGEITSQVDITDYNLPEEFNYVSYTIYDISDKFAMFSSSSVGSYLLNKETKDFTFFNSSSVSTYSQVVNGNMYFWLTNLNLFKVDIETGKYEIVSLNSGVAFTSLSFMGYSGDKIVIKGSSNATGSLEYYFAIYNTLSGECEVIEISNTQYNYTTDCFDLGNYFYFTRTYDVSSSSSGTYSSYLYNKESKQMITIESYYLLNDDTYIVKENKMYAIMRNGSSISLCSVDLTNGEVSVLQSSMSSSGKMFELEKGFVYAYQKTINSNTYSSIYAYYTSYEDDSVVKIGYEDDDNTYIIAYYIEGHLLFAPRTDSSSNRYGRVAIFNEEIKKLETIYTSLVSSSSASYCNVYEFDGEYYISSDNDNFAKMTFNDNGDISFKNLTLKTNPTYTKYQVGEKKYIIEDNGLKYYDFKNDIYKSLKSVSSSSSCDVVQLDIKDNIATIYASNNVKYEFNLETLTFKAVAYWE